MSDEVELVAPFSLAYRYKRSTGPVLGRFLSSLRAGRIEGVQCEDGTVLVPPGPNDPRTGRRTLDVWKDVGPGGAVQVFTHGPPGADGRAVAWGLVLLDGADVPLVHRLLADPAALKVGLRVRAVFADEPVGAITDIVGFAPEGNAP